MTIIRKLDRRQFLKVSSGATAGLFLGIQLPGSAFASDGDSSDVFAPGVFLEIDRNGIVTVWASRSEMGQGPRTAFPMLVAEELEADWAKIRVEQAPLDPKYGPQRTGGSLSVRELWEPLRRAGATARIMLVTAGAAVLGVAPSECHAENGEVIHEATGRRIPYGKLVEEAATLPVPDPAEVPLKEPKDFRILGTSKARLDGHDIVTGRASYGVDQRPPGMLFATFERCPVIFGKLKSYDDSRAIKIAGVRHVVPIKGGFDLHPMLQWSVGVAVVADTTWAALKGREALEIEWELGEYANLDSDELREAFVRDLDEDGIVTRDDGDASAVVDSSETVIEASYDAPYLSHSPMEPMNATADVREDRCEIWAPVQFPHLAQDITAIASGLPKEKIAVNITLLGGGFGRRIYSDYTGEAVLISKAIGAPVQLFWTREDDTRHGFYRPVSHHRFRAVLDGDSRPVAWSHKIVGPSRRATMRPDTDEPHDSETYHADELPYKIPNVRVEYVHHYVPLPTGPWRAVAYSQGGFVLEGFIDELAHAAGKDPLEYRSSLLDWEGPFGGERVDARRMKAVLELAAKKAGWGRKMPEGAGQGLAVTADHGSFVAHVAEVRVDGDQVKVDRFVSAIDCGWTVNPDMIHAQFEGAIALALSATLKSEITLKDGRVAQGNFDDYDVIRIDEMPQVELHIMPSTERPGGVGEPPLPGVAPAVTNAIFAATGKRLRRIPVRPEDLA